jgi:NADH:ubiquinone oxidoreductase subunit 6 (subunit J)
MVLFLFVLMLLSVKREQVAAERGGRTLRGAAAALVTLFVLQLGAVLARLRLEPAAQYDASTRRMAETLFSAHFLYVFEATSVLILAALVAAVALAKKEL